jgi:TonB-linked SusC/RagA family outer membrane protein
MKKVIRLRTKCSLPIKLNLKMRITTLLLLVSLFQLQANESYAQKTKVTLNYDNVTLETVFNKIESITDFKFIYKDKEIDYTQKVSIKVKKEKLSKVLRNLLSDAKISYSVYGKQIILKPLKIALNKEQLKTIKEKLQKIQVTGIIIDKSGTPLPGASIIEKGTTNGTESDFDGNFKISVNNDNAILVIQYLGYAKKEVAVKNKSILKIILIEDADSLDEIVVIGYGKLSRAKVIGAVTSVGSDDISQLPVNGVDDAIAGRVAGVQIVSNGAPGAGSSINIRGIGTLTAGGSPLIVIDGYPLTEGSDINAINPNDIESMSVLKDAASTAIYGSRGANGVIIITSKKAKKDKVTFNFNTFSGFQQVLNEPKFMNAYQFAEVVKEARDWGYVSADPANRNENDSNATRLSQGAVSRHLIPTNFDKYLAGTPGLTDNNWLDDLFRSGRIESYDVSVSGRSGRTNWYVSGGYFKQEGLIVGSDFKRYIAKINLETKFNDKLKFGLNLSPSVSNTNSVVEGWTDSPMQQAILSEPFFTPYNNLGELNISQQIRWHNNGGTDGALAENPIAIALRKKDEKNKFRLYGSTFLEYELIEGLNLKTLFGGDYDNSFREQFRPSTIGSYRNDVNSAVPWAKEQNKVRKNIISENTLTYTKEFNKHNINALAGYSYQKENYTSTFVNAPKLDSNNITNIAGTAETTTSKDISEWVRISYFGRIQYDYDSKYLASVSTRRDGSSRFGTNTKFGNFSSFSAGWVVNNEDFFPKESFLTKLKLRYSWGQTGNDQIGDFGSIATLKNLNGLLNGSLSTGQIPSTSPNADLSWETSVTNNIGFDLGLFDSKLNLVVDYFVAKTEDMLLNVPVPLQSGFTRSLQNVGKMENKGLEIVLSTSDINLGPVKWNSSLNFTTIKNTVKELGPGQTEIIDGAHITKVGNSIGELYGYQVNGIYKSQAEINSSAQNGTDVRVGDWRIVDTSGDGIINDDDRQSLGATLPDFTYGMNNRFSYKNFDLNVFVDGVQGVNVLSRTVRNASNGQGFSNQFQYYYENRWHPTNNPNGFLARPDYTQSSERLRANVSSAFIEDGSFIRVRNITLGYSLPDQILEKINLSRLRLYVTAKNPFISTNFKGFNPQQRDNNNPLSPSDTQGVYPLNKSFVIGLNVSF